MKPSDLLPEDPSPQRALITSGPELREGLAVVLGLARRTVRAMHRDLALFDLSTIATVAVLERLLLRQRGAHVRLLVDDPGWLDTRAARLRQLQRQFPHALELRVASPEDPVGDEARVLVDDHAVLDLVPSPVARGDLWLHHQPRAQPLTAAFDRRWEAGGHNLAVYPLGLG
jgi:hypothetical protein